MYLSFVIIKNTVCLKYKTDLFPTKLSSPCLIIKSPFFTMVSELDASGLRQRCLLSGLNQICSIYVTCEVSVTPALRVNLGTSTGPRFMWP